MRCILQRDSLEYKYHLLGLVHLYLVVVVPAQVGQEAAYRAPCVHLPDNEKCSSLCSSSGLD